MAGKKNVLVRRIKNLSVLKKMILALVICVIIPIVVLGTIMTLRVLRLSEQNQYEVQINQLTKAAKDIENLYTTTEQEAAVLASDNSVQAVTEYSASVIDYRNAAEKMEDASQKIESYSCVAISRDGEIIFQRGSKYMNETGNRSSTEQIENGSEISLWATEHPVLFQKGINHRQIDQISYYTTILREVTLEKVGILSIHIDAQELLEQLLPYSDKEEDVVEDAMIYDGNGQVMVSRQQDANMERLCWEEFLDREEKSDSGYFPVKADGGEYIVLYTKCGTSGWYLFQVEEKLGIYGAQITFMACAVLLCIMFGIVYGIIQNRTILKPLKHLSRRMDAVKGGVLEKKYYETSGDEIGNVEKGFEDMVAHIHDLINQVYVQTIKKQDAEREMLLTKMNPHFLYNALDSIHWLAFRNKDYEVSEQLEALADVYRHILQFGEGKLAVEKELEFIENYIFLLECQMGERVEFIRDVPETLYNYKIPKLLIQPMVENAMVHGLKDVQSGGKVKIRIRKRGDKMVITVIDNGAGCDAQSVMERIRNKNGMDAFALRNIEERILLCGEEGCGLRVYSGKRGGCIVQAIVKWEADTR